MASWKDAVTKAADEFPRPQGVVFSYGTAGFRMPAKFLDSTMVRVGLLAALRSAKLDNSTIGVMITASHNPPDDNGVKVVDPIGEMLDTAWEIHATAFANAESAEDLVSLIEQLHQGFQIKANARPKVVYARDTRASSLHLSQVLRKGLDAMGCESEDYGILTTPQLHYITRCLNLSVGVAPYGTPSEDGYYTKLASAFKLAMQHRKTKNHITVDCANGVGALKLKALLDYIPRAQDGGVDIKIVNDEVNKPEMLNMQCGADYVKTQQRAPPSSKAAPFERCASFDGDADRIVYYFLDGDKQFCLLDGDRIATLAASFLVGLVQQAGLANEISLAVVQTAYANGGSTDYIENILKLPVKCTPTGVKHLHAAAAKFHIGVYFEANGHGTVLFSEGARHSINTTQPKSPAQLAALDTLKGLMELINQTVGDAISDLLLVEVILAHKSWGLAEWHLMYEDLPNKLLRVEVSDRTLFKTYDAERRLESPPGVQEKIDDLCEKYKFGRAFVRASGTEDVVRVYAEAQRKLQADELGHKVAEFVKFAASEGR